MRRAAKSVLPFWKMSQASQHLGRTGRGEFRGHGLLGPNTQGLVPKSGRQHRAFIACQTTRIPGHSDQRHIQGLPISRLGLRAMADGQPPWPKEVGGDVSRYPTPHGHSHWRCHCCAGSEPRAVTEPTSKPVHGMSPLRTPAVKRHSTPELPPNTGCPNDSQAPVDPTPAVHFWAMAVNESNGSEPGCHCKSATPRVAWMIGNAADHCHLDWNGLADGWRKGMEMCAAPFWNPTESNRLAMPSVFNATPLPNVV